MEIRSLKTWIKNMDSMYEELNEKMDKADMEAIQSEALSRTIHKNILKNIESLRTELEALSYYMERF